MRWVLVAVVAVALALSGCGSAATVVATGSPAVQPTPTPSPTLTPPGPATMTLLEAADYFEVVGCPATRARTDVVSFVGSTYGDVDLEGVSQSAARTIRRYQRAAGRLADPPLPWPEFVAADIERLRAELERGAQQLQPVTQVRNQVDLAEAWSRFEQLPRARTIRSVRVLLSYSPRDTERPGCRR